MSCFLSQNHFRDLTEKMCGVRFVCAMVRNAGQLPQPFWLGTAHGGSSCAVANCSART